MPDYTIDAVVKTADVIEALCKFPKPLVSKDIEYFTGLSKNQVFRILKTLEDAKFVECIGGRWCISVHLIDLIARDAHAKIERMGRALRRTLDAKKYDAASP